MGCLPRGAIFNNVICTVSPNQLLYPLYFIVVLLYPIIYSLFVYEVEEAQIFFFFDIIFL